jgi:sigma-E factor negative regulatory protein RseB
VSRTKGPGWRVASVAALLSLVGSGIAALMLTNSPGGSQLAGGSGLVDEVPGPARAPQTAAGTAGLQLLQQAVAACQNTSYRGVQVVLWRSQGTSTVSVVNVWHQPGRVTLVQAAGAAAPGPDAAAPSGAMGYQDPDGILGVSQQLLNLLRSNYQVVYAGRGAVANRGALLVEVRRPGGGVAARFWLDAASKLPLRREIFSSGAQMISEDAFTDLQLGNRVLGAAPAVAAAPWATQLDDATLAVLRGQGWPLPGQLPGNLMLFTATQMSTSSGQVVGMSYSDGLAVVSLFVQRGQLAGPMPGWRPVSLDGRTVYAIDPASQGERSVAWSAAGFVYTLIADAPVATVGQVVAVLPGNTPPGFWQRIGHGLHRLASWANPLRH